MVPNQDSHSRGRFALAQDNGVTAGDWIIVGLSVGFAFVFIVFPMIYLAIVIHVDDSRHRASYGRYTRQQRAEQRRLVRQQWEEWRRKDEEFGITPISAPPPALTVPPPP